ncbi:hypothetical protein P7C73_g1834, partial [Tremellales sp. Uapishka_1]
MSAPFPQLLKRSAFTTHDPLITRIYTSTPSSVSQHGDWGLKSAISLRKGPRYIKVNSLDAGPGIGCDWRSGEKEARFMEIWGQGGIGWRKDGAGGSPARDLKKRRASLEDDAFSRPAERDETVVEKWLPNIERMSGREFERYLDGIRAKRAEFLKIRLQNLPRSTRESRTLPEDQTLIAHSLSKDTLPSHSADFQAGITGDALAAPSSTTLHSTPHALHGLSYSPLPTSSTAYPGRVLDRLSRNESQQNKGRQSGGLVDNNQPWIVGIGGLTALNENTHGRIGDKPTLKQIDYASASHDGSARFKINSATLRSPVNVFDVQNSNLEHRYKDFFSVSAAKQPSPLDTIKFDIVVEEADDAAVEVGSPEWVTREPKLAGVNRLLYDLGLPGGPRKDRTQGEGRRTVHEWEEKMKKKEVRVESAKTVENLLRRMGAMGGKASS